MLALRGLCVKLVWKGVRLPLGHKEHQWELTFSPAIEMNILEQIKIYAYKSLAFLKQCLDCQNLG